MIIVMNLIILLDPENKQLRWKIINQYKNLQQWNQNCHINLSSTLNQAPISSPNAFNQMNQMNDSPQIN